MISLNVHYILERKGGLILYRGYLFHSFRHGHLKWKIKKIFPSRLWEGLKWQNFALGENSCVELLTVIIRHLLLTRKIAGSSDLLQSNFRCHYGSLARSVLKPYASKPRPPNYDAPLLTTTAKRWRGGCARRWAALEVSPTILRYNVIDL